MKRASIIRICIGSLSLLQGAISTRTNGHVRCLVTSSQRYKKDNLPWCGQGHSTDPIDILQPLAMVPLIPEQDRLYNPSPDFLEKSDSLFDPSIGGGIESIRKILEPEKEITWDIPEVAVVGRSNVGKSSLIRALYFTKNDPNLKLKVSGKPGKTRSINMYTIDKQFTLVDLPGYGERMPPHYHQSVEPYLQTRKQLARIILLMDHESPFDENDRIGINMLERFGRPYTIALTKIDQISAHQALRSILEIREVMTPLTYVFPQIFLISSMYEVGLSHLRGHIVESCGLLSTS